MTGLGIWAPGQSRSPCVVSSHLHSLWGLGVPLPTPPLVWGAGWSIRLESPLSLELFNLDQGLWTRHRGQRQAQAWETLAHILGELQDQGVTVNL